MLKIHMSQSKLPKTKIGSGAYSTIYKFHLYRKKYAVKSQQIEIEDRALLNKNIDEVLREYFIYKIASVLEFGPKI